MDSFEPVRAAATKLHARLVADGADPWRPFALVNAAVAKLGLDLAWLPEGDPALKGALGG